MNHTAAVVGAAPLEERQLVASAEAATGLSDWGEDQRFRIGLGKLLASINEGETSQSIIEPARMRLTGSLMNLLHFTADEKQHPEILQGTIERPVVVVGLPRTGTTVLYDLLALDPGARAPRNWEYAMPWPAPEVATWDSDPRIAQLDAVFAQLLAQAPKLSDIQDIHARACGECNLAFTHHFASTQFQAEWGVASYGRWLREISPPGRYAAHRRLLQHLQWKGPRGRWTLKSPEHLCTINELLEAYPDACLVWTHRDPLSAFSSLSSMLRELHRGAGVKEDLLGIGRFVMDTWGAALEHATQARARHPHIERAVIDIAHRDVIKNKLEVVRRIHRHFDLPFSAAHERALRSSAMAAVTRRFGKHSHNPADFGISLEEVSKRVPNYLARFGALLDGT
jgi:hypothetical protein